MSGSHLSRDFFDLVKAIGESKSKQVHLVIRTPPLSLLRHCSLAMIERRALDKPGRRHATVHRKSDRSVSVVQVDSTNPLTRTQRDVSWPSARRDRRSRSLRSTVLVAFVCLCTAKEVMGEARQWRRHGSIRRQPSPHVRRRRLARPL